VPDAGSGICCGLVQGIIVDELPVGGYLYIKSGFKLAVQHMVFFHAHKGGIGISLGVAVPPIQYLFLFFISLKLFRPSLPDPFNLLFDLDVTIHITQGFIYTIHNLGNFFCSYIFSK
jgi:hypothetical protein